MTKNKEEEKKSVQIKVSTGAWWKSTAVEEVVTTESDKKKTPARSPRKPRSKPKASTTKSDSAKAETAKIEAAEESPAEQTATASQPAPTSEAQSETSKKPSRGRRGRKRAPKEVSTTPPDIAVEEGPANSEQPPLKEQASEGEPASETESDAEQSPKSKSARKRRSRRSRKAKSESQTTAESASPEPAEAEEATEPEELEKDEHGFVTEDDEEIADEEDVKEQKKVFKLLINAEEPEECRLALLEDGRLESIHVSTAGRTLTKNNIYKAKIVAIEPSLQAAFVDYGREKNGFLPFSEIHPEYFRPNLDDKTRKLVESHQWKKLSITDVVEKGQEILAQVVKEEVGKKGANMTTYLSLPGRCVVLMPGSDSAGVSRKISSEEKRGELRDIIKELGIPEGIGWIVRTASIDITKAALTRDVEYLLKLWEDIRAKGQALNGVGQVYDDNHSVQRFLREHFDPSIEEIQVDDDDALEQVNAFVEMLPQVQRDRVKVRRHKGARPIFNQYSIEDQIESIYQPQVSLPSGGSIVIDPTEALVSIDVNSGSTSKGKSFEESIFQANMEAATELARQLRLRDLGGLIVVDFIDMRNRKHIQTVERQVKQAMKRDKAKVDFSRISKFGLMQISRQKLGAPIEASNYHRCEHCKGRGMVRSVETQALFYLRRIQTSASRKAVEKIECRFPVEIALYLLNKKRQEVLEMENRYGVEIVINADADMKPGDHEISLHKAEK